MQPAATSGQALANLQNFTSSAQTPQAALQGAEQGLGVDAAQQNVSGLRSAITNTTNLLNQVAPSVMGRTANSLVTSAQATRQIGNESAPISRTLSDQTSKEQTAESDLSNLETRAQNKANLTLQGQANQESALKGIYDALYGKESDAAKMAEQQREARASESQNAAALAEKTSSDRTSNNLAAQKLAQDNASTQAQYQTIGAIGTNLKHSAGGDGYVSPQSYQGAANDWVQSGYSLADFNKYFGYLKNPNNPNYFK